MAASTDKTASSEETVFTPTYHREPDRFATHYRHVFSGAGLFRCSYTNLVFDTKKDGDIYYRAVCWNDRLLQSARRCPASLLFKIECADDVLSRLHLAHALIKVGDVDLFVAQITEDGLNMVKPDKVTETHAVVSTNTLGSYGLVSNHPFFQKAINGQVLMFLRQPRRRAVMSVFVLAANIPITEVQSQHQEDLHIQSPNSHCVLTRDKKYKLIADPLESNPEIATFFMGYGPNYHATFEVYLDFDAGKATIEILEANGKRIWKEEDVDISDYRPEEGSP